MDTQYKNLKYPIKIWNTQLSQKEMGKYPIASYPYLELCLHMQSMAVDEGSD